MSTLIQRIDLGVRCEKNTSVIQLITKHTAHLPTLCNEQMCSRIYRRLIFKWLSNTVHTEVNSFNSLKAEHSIFDITYT